MVYQVAAKGGQVAAQTTAKAGAATAKAAGKGVKKGAEKAAQAGAKTAQKGSAAAGRAGARAGQGAARTAGRAGRAPSGHPNLRRGDPRGPGKQARRALDHARQGDKDRKDRNKKLRKALRHPITQNRKNLRSAMRRQVGLPDRSDEAAVRAGRKVAGTTGRGVFKVFKKVTFTDRNQKPRKYLRRTIYIVVLLSVLILYPLMTVWGSPPMLDDYADADAVPVPSLDDGPIPAQLIPEVAKRTDIPEVALRAYSAGAGGDWPIDWKILAGIGKVECDHGRSKELYCSTPYNVWRTDHGGAGERGPMQHLGHLWRVGENDPNAEHVEGPPTPKNDDSTHVATDGDGDGVADPWNWYDAVAGTARKLTLYRKELKAKDPKYDTDLFMIASYNAGVGGATGRGTDIANAINYTSYVVKVEAEITRIKVATAGMNLGSTGGIPTCASGGSGAKPEAQDHITPATQNMYNAAVTCFGTGKGIGCYDPRNGTFEHPRGRACDFMQSSGAAQGAEQAHGQGLAEWVAANAKQLNVLYVIWYGKWWTSRGPYKPWSQWDDYHQNGQACSSPSVCGATQGHYDHVHVSVRYVTGDPSWAACIISQCTENW